MKDMEDLSGMKRMVLGLLKGPAGVLTLLAWLAGGLALMALPTGATHAATGPASASAPTAETVPLTAGAWLPPVTTTSHLEVSPSDRRSLIVHPRNGDQVVAPYDGEVLYRGAFDWVWGDGILLKHSRNLYSVITIGRVESFLPGVAVVGQRVARGTAIGRITGTDSGTVEWTLFSYVPEGAGTDPAAKWVLPSVLAAAPSELTADHFADNVALAMRWLGEGASETTSRVLDVTELIGLGRLDITVQASSVSASSLSFALDSGPISAGTAGPLSVLLPPGMTVLKTTEKGFFGSSVGSDSLLITTGSVARATIGKKANRSAGVVQSGVSNPDLDAPKAHLARLGRPAPPVALAAASGEAANAVAAAPAPAPLAATIPDHQRNHDLRQADLARFAAEVRAAEEQQATERRQREEATRIAEQRQRDEAARLAEQRQRDEAARLAEQRQREEATRIAEQRQRDEAARLAEQRQREEATRLAEQRQREEATRLAAARQRAEDEDRARLVAQARQREQEAEATRQELARVREQLAKAEQLAQAEKAAAPTYRPGRRKALVIGNDAYTRVARLEAARADAQAIGKALGSVGFEVSIHTDLSERGMKQALRDFKGRVQGGDEVVFFFAGHGVQLGGVNYLLPTDINGESEDQVRDEAIQLQRVLDDMQEKSAGFMLAVVDACRDNPFRSAGRAIGGRGLAPTAAATGQMVIYSAGAGQQALDRLSPTDKTPNGVFTRAFLKEMLKPGVPVDRVLRNVRNEVVQMARSVGREQTPALYDQAIGDFYFQP